MTLLIDASNGRDVSQFCDLPDTDSAAIRYLVIATRMPTYGVR